MKFPATYFYAVLCEATHPNVLSNTLYVDDSSSSKDGVLIYKIRKDPKTIEPYLTLYDFVSVPTVESVKILDHYIHKIKELDSALNAYIQKVRRVTT